MKVRIIQTALADLIEIQDWLDQCSPAASAKWIGKLTRACRTLGRFPRRYPTAGMADLRRRPLGPYLIFYRIREDVEVVRVLHGARDWTSLLDSDA